MPIPGPRLVSIILILMSVCGSCAEEAAVVLNFIFRQKNNPSFEVQFNNTTKQKYDGRTMQSSIEDGRMKLKSFAYGVGNKSSSILTVVEAKMLSQRRFRVSVRTEVPIFVEVTGNGKLLQENGKKQIMENAQSLYDVPIGIWVFDVTFED